MDQAESSIQGQSRLAQLLSGSQLGSVNERTGALIFTVFTALKMGNVKRPMVTDHSLRHTAVTVALKWGLL